MKKWILLSGLLAVLAASQVMGDNAAKPKPKGPPTPHCPCEGK